MSLPAPFIVLQALSAAAATRARRMARVIGLSTDCRLSVGAVKRLPRRKGSGRPRGPGPLRGVAPALYLADTRFAGGSAVADLSAHPARLARRPDGLARCGGGLCVPRAQQPAEGRGAPAGARRAPR